MNRNSFLKAFVLLTVVAGYPFVAAAQQSTKAPDDLECRVPLIPGNQVDRKVKILDKPEPKFSRNERGRYKHGVITLSAIFCGSGKVTDIKLKEGLTPGLNENAIEAARLIKFVPAEKDGAKVSQSLFLEYHIRY